MSSGTVSSSTSAARATAVGLRSGHAGQQRGGPVAGRVGLTGGGDDLVAGGAERGGQDGADATGADHTHPVGTGLRSVGLRHRLSNLSFQSRRPLLLDCWRSRIGYQTMCS